jgi:PAS domain S-box-containing protein
MKFISFIFIILTMFAPLKADKIQNVTLQLKWKHQFQFAGYYAAIEKGYYKELGINVDLKEAVVGKNPSNEVIDGKAEFGVCNSDIILMRSQNKKAVVLATVYQHSPLILLASKKSGIYHVQDLIGKRIALEPNEADIVAYISDEGVPLNKCKIEYHTFNTDKLINGEIDAITAYTTDELYSMQKANFDYSIIDPSMGGIDFYGDVLFTTEKFIKNNPELVDNFRKASLKGWKYAMNHPEEIIQLIYNKYSQRHSIEHLRFEAEKMKNLIMPDVVEMGYTNPGRWEAISKTYKNLKMIDESFSTKGLLYSDYTEPETVIDWNLIAFLLIIILIIGAVAIFFRKSSKNLKNEIENRRKIELQLREVSKVAKVGGWSLDIKTKKLTWTEETYRIHEVDPGGEPKLDEGINFYAPEYRGKLVEAIELAMQKGVPFDLELPFITAKGNSIWVRSIGKIDMALGIPVRLYGIFQDITAQKQNEIYQEMSREIMIILNGQDTLKKSIERVLESVKTHTGFDAVGMRLQDGEDYPYFVQEGFPEDFLIRENTLIERKVDGGMCRDKDGNVSLECTCGLVISGKTDPANPLFTKGGSAWTNDSFPILDIPLAQDPRRNPRNQCIHKGYATIALVPIKMKDKIVGLLQLNDHRKNLLSLTALEQLENLTEHIGEALIRKHTEEKLQQSEEKFRNVFEYSLVGKSMTTLDGKLTTNKAFTEMLGYTEDELSKLKWQEITHPDSIENDKRVFDSILAGEYNSRRWEKRYIQKNGNTVWVDISTALHRDINGKPLYFITAINNITKRKLAEQEIRIKNEELQKLNAEKDKFFSIISHDLRSPFNSFLGLTQILEDELANLSKAEIQKISLMMNTNAKNLFRLLENLLEWSRIKQGLIPFNPELIQLYPAAYESIGAILEPAKIKGVDINVDIPTEIDVFADNNMLQTIIRNLVSNAMKFTRRDGSITLSAKETDGKGIEVSIKDTGIGMNSKLLENLFRIDVNTNRKGNDGELSTGLGLILCKDFVEKHGGKLWAESEEGKGSTFYFTIPYNKIKIDSGDKNE